MTTSARVSVEERAALPMLRELADRMFSRAAGAPLIAGNHVGLLENGRENYARWLAAIRAAKREVHFENYFIQDDRTGREFAEEFIAAARRGVRVRVIHDWFGSIGKAPRRFWRALRAAGVEVRCYNPPRLSSPVGWLSRDHRKSIVVDGEVGFVTGLCVGSMWMGDPERGIEPWRDTGVEVRGPAIAEIERAFARIWALTGSPLPDDRVVADPPRAGDRSLRIVSSEPATAGMLRLDQLVAAMARRRLWITDAYYSGIASYVQALRSSARDGVDVRLLVPNATDVPFLKPFSRAGYRPLLEAGVRVFEWNGSMVHAKTAVADGRWARVGSTNLNVTSWLGNCELDAVIEDAMFASRMEEMYERDLANATEVVIDARRRVSAPGEPRHPRARRARGSGSATAATAGALRLSNAVGAALTNRRVLGPVEARLAMGGGLVLCTLAALVAFFPRALAYPAAALGLWGGLALLCNGVRLRRAGAQRSATREHSAVGADDAERSA